MYRYHIMYLCVIIYTYTYTYICMMFSILYYIQHLYTDILLYSDFLTLLMKLVSKNYLRSFYHY